MILQFNFSGDVPLYLQLRNQVVMGIAEGRLAPGEKLPTVRALAEESGINVMTVSKAYNLLKQEGYITTDRRKGTVVCPQSKDVKIKDETLQGLRLRLSELRAAGMSKAEVSSLLEQLCEEAGL